MSDFTNPSRCGLCGQDGEYEEMEYYPPALVRAHKECIAKEAQPDSPNYPPIEVDKAEDYAGL